MCHTGAKELFTQLHGVRVLKKPTHSARGLAPARFITDAIELEVGEMAFLVLAVICLESGMSEIRVDGRILCFDKA